MLFIDINCIHDLRVIFRHQVVAEKSTGRNTKTSRSITRIGPTTLTTTTMRLRKRCIFFLISMLIAYLSI